MTAPRLTRGEISVLRSLVRRSGIGRPVSLNRIERRHAVPLWRRSLIEVWSRYVPEFGSQGPYFSLTVAGHRLASLFAAPRQRRQSSHPAAQGASR